MRNFLTDLKVLKKISLAFLVLIGSSLIVSGVCWTSLSKLETTSKWTTHTFKVISSLNQIVEAMVNQETGVRGYLVSGDRDFLAPKIAGEKMLNEALSSVQTLTADNATQQARIAEVRDLATTWDSTVAAKEIELMSNPATIEAARQLEASGAGKSSMDAIRAKVSVMISEEAALLEKRSKEAQAATIFARVTTIAGGLVILALAFAALTGLHRVLVMPLNALTRAMQATAEGQEGSDVPGQERRDELGDMARAFNANAERIARLAEAQRANEDRLAVERRNAMLTMADNFEKSVGGVVSLVSSAATEMQATASQLTSTAQETSVQAQSVSAAAEEAGTNVTSVASSAEELGASISEIGRQVERSAEKSKLAVRQAQATSTVVKELSEAATRINDIVAMISGIASQTNLLALNATIESARAGEAGKGFAVVASEVKTLASQTSRATDEISVQIANIQNTTARAVDAIGAITSSIVEIDEVSNAIAAAVDQQAAATNEIVQAVTLASSGTTEVTSNITGVARSAEETGAGASQVLSASSELADQAAMLSNEVQNFLSTVRAA
ncbi:MULTISPECIES: methyl-accepting chemotaxis protein [Asticcacaulis]|uniref:methyl-accepting chemotaxis protein n=1 Tax=Asticcacaulis TaxID=76890 RepID=UPI001AE500CB|nr:MULTISPECIES: CHASE3 domain-containing protein [Asticcacaulis]MBP2159840.1 methyl-accepting chemotaxis protein [Asticcacaulis solisilvae]MDR6800885.1 methyl-accepting chemotaxis protein [Asticcacaulis sp. BE141]